MRFGHSEHDSTVVGGAKRGGGILAPPPLKDSYLLRGPSLLEATTCAMGLSYWILAKTGIHSRIKENPI